MFSNWLRCCADSSMTCECRRLTAPAPRGPMVQTRGSPAMRIYRSWMGRTQRCVPSASILRSQLRAKVRTWCTRTRGTQTSRAMSLRFWATFLTSFLRTHWSRCAPGRLSSSAAGTACPPTWKRLLTRLPPLSLLFPMVCERTSCAATRASTQPAFTSSTTVLT